MPDEHPDLGAMLNALEQGRTVSARGEIGPEADDDPAELELLRRLEAAIESGTVDELGRELRQELGEEE